MKHFDIPTIVSIRKIILNEWLTSLRPSNHSTSHSQHHFNAFLLTYLTLQHLKMVTIQYKWKFGLPLNIFYQKVYQNTWCEHIKPSNYLSILAQLYKVNIQKSKFLKISWLKKFYFRLILTLGQWQKIGV